MGTHRITSTMDIIYVGDMVELSKSWQTIINIQGFGFYTFVVYAISQYLADFFAAKIGINVNIIPFIMKLDLSGLLGLGIDKIILNLIYYTVFYLFLGIGIMFLYNKMIKKR
jgi:hypothetical protein